MWYKNICYDSEGRIVFDYRMSNVVFDYRVSKVQPGSPWRYSALARSSWRRSQLPCRATAPSLQGVCAGTYVRACTARQRRVMQGCSTRHLGFVGQFTPLKFPKRIWLIWLLWLLSVNGCICLISYFGSQWFNKFIGFIVACITWLLCIHWLPWLHRLLIRHWLIVFASCHRVNRQSWSRQSSMLRMCLDGHPLRMPTGSGTWSAYHIGCIVYIGHLRYIGFNWGSNELDICICLSSRFCAVFGVLGFSGVIDTIGPMSS